MLSHVFNVGSFNNLMEYITVCLDSTNKVEHWKSGTTNLLF